MKLYYYCSKNFKHLRDRFVASLKDEFEIHEAWIEELEHDGNFGGGQKCWELAVSSTLHAIKQHPGEVILKCDVDICFYQPVIPLIMQMIAGKDIVFQRERNDFGVNMGFMALRCNQKTFDFWSKVLYLSKKYELWDQGVCNLLLNEQENQISWDRFPSSIWCYTQKDLPENLIVHHANFSRTPQAKIDQLDKVSMLYTPDGRRKENFAESSPASWEAQRN